jgi:dTDP-glucose 4,6-dehydratase
MRVLVAGGAGFIGSHVCRALLSRGHSVICLDDLSTGSRANIAALEDQAGFEFLESDVADAPLVAVDRVLHLASPASPIDYDRLPLQTLAANSSGTWRLLDVARACDARLTFASTSEVYGDPLVHPQTESYWGNVDPVGPRSCYDEAKRFGEALIFAMRRTTGVHANVVRIFNTYGPRMRHDDGRVVPELMSAALEGRPMIVHGDGSQTRSFCYVGDLVEGLLHVLLDDTNDGEIFNLGNPHEITIRELAHEIRRLAGTGSDIEFQPRRPGDPERRRPDIGRIRERYGWLPRTQLAEGLRLTMETWPAQPAVAARRTPEPVPIA